MDETMNESPNPVPAAKPAGLWLKRRQLWIEPKLQLGLVREVMVVLCLGVVLGIANVHVLSLVQEWYGASADAPLDWMSGVIVWLYALTMLGASVGMVCIASIFYSHRVAGPMRKLAARLARLAEGDLAGSVSLRDSDHLTELAEATNRVSERWRATVVEVRALADRLAARAQETGDAEIQAHCRELERLLAGFEVAPGPAPGPSSRAAAPADGPSPPLAGASPAT